MINIIEKETGIKIPLSSTGLNAVIINFADGDGRRLVNILELMIGHKSIIDDKAVKGLLQKKVIYHDRNGDLHYNLISALHKSIRASTVTQPYTGYQDFVSWRRSKFHTSKIDEDFN